VRCRLALRCLEPSTIALAVAVSNRSGELRGERLAVTRADSELELSEVVDPLGGRTHLVHAPPGPLIVDYQASLVGPPPLPAPTTDIDDEQLTALLQSRYCPSDALTGFARATFWGCEPESATAHRVAEWVFEFLAYEAGSSRSLDTAVETLLFARGVCRDFAHLTIALCRGLGIPARLVAVYAPGLSPMDFHAVAEVHTEHGWEVLDATRLAPRQSLVRIATGRDAADTAFVSTIRGDVALDTAEVLAVVEGELPEDDHGSVVRLP
jgi:transglutaminase-like putative cysteine protease